MKLDALGNPIVVGNKYGYSIGDGGWTDVVVGQVSKETAEKVTLVNIVRTGFLYGRPTDRKWKEATTVSVKSCILFPVAESNEQDG